MTDAAKGNEHVALFPWERGEVGHSEADAAMKLFESPDSDEEHPEGTDEPQDTEEVEGPGDDEGDEPDETPEESEVATEEDDDSESDDQPSPVLHKYKANGTEKEVTLEELTRLASAGDDFTRKSQGLAEDRRAFEADRTAVREARQRYIEQTEAVESYMLGQMPAAPDWAKIKAEDPTGFAARYAEHQLAEAQIGRVQAAKQAAIAAQQKDYEDQRNALIDAEQTKLVAAIPELADEKTGRDLSRKIQDYMVTTFGYTANDIDQIVDHRVMLLVNKARLWDEAQAKAGTTREEIRKKAAPVTVVKPGTPKSMGKSAKADLTKKMERARTSGKFDDAVAAIEALI